MRHAASDTGGAKTPPVPRARSSRFFVSRTWLFCLSAAAVLSVNTTAAPTLAQPFAPAQAGTTPKSDRNPFHFRLFPRDINWGAAGHARPRAAEADEAGGGDSKPRPHKPIELRLGAFDVGRTGVSPMGKQLGIGLAGGSPTSVTLRYATSASEGLVFGAGSLGGPYWNTPTLALHADYVWHPNVLVRTPNLDLSWFIGGGAWVIVGERLRSIVPIMTPWVPVAYAAVGARFPIGISLALQKLPIELYLQGDPSFFVFPGLSVWMGGCAGFRFYI